MNYSCLLVDDEPIAIDILKRYLQNLDEFKVVESFTHPVKAFEYLHRHPVDLLFLDIQMPELTGLELLQALRQRPEVILTTAYREFALDGFDWDVVDYLLKPISFERFLKAIDKFQSRKNTPGAGAVRTAHALPADGEQPHFFVRADRKHVKIYLHEILFLESLKDYVRITTSGGKILTKETLGHFEQLLPADAFLRVHRSFIVARDKVKALSNDGLEIGQQIVPVGRMYKLSVERSVLGAQ